MLENNSNIFWQLQKRQQDEDLVSRGVNPNLSSPTTSFTNPQPVVPNNDTKKSYNWSRRYFYYGQDRLIPLNPDILNYASEGILFQEFPSHNGNLTLLNVEKNIVNTFNASLFRVNAGTANIYVNWSGGLAIYLNSGVVTKNDYTPFLSRSISLGLNSGWNDLEIMLYSIDDSQSFSLNSEIGLMADDWETPSYSTPLVPSNLSVSIDLNATKYKDGNAAVLRWDPTPANTTLGYNVFRTGPYNTGVSAPLINATSGYYVSGIGLGIHLGSQVREAHYAVSSYNSTGESLPTQSFFVSLGPVFSGVTGQYGFSSGISGGALDSGCFSYMVAAVNPIGLKFASDSQIVFTVFNTGNCSVLNWSPTNDVDNYSIYRFSGAIDIQPWEAPYLTGQKIGTVGNSVTSFIDSGYQTPYITGISELVSNTIDLTTFSRGVTNYKNNSSYISWSGVTGASGYYIYRTFYSGTYSKNSLVGNTSDLFFIDSGIDPIQGKPTISENIVSLNYGTKKYKDQGLIGNQTYSYSISSYNYGLNESPLTTGFSVTVGDPFPPATPSGITITSFNGFSTIGWINGTEPDLQATNIYKSDTISGTYNLIGTTVGNTFSTFIGYSGTPLFKLANFDTSDNLSPLSTAYQGSGTLIADNVQLSNFRIMTTMDIDLYQYLSSSNSNVTSPYMGSLIPIVSDNPDSLLGESTLFMVDTNAGLFKAMSVVEDNSNIGYIITSPVPSGLSGVAGLVTNNTAKNDYIMTVAYYSGTKNNDWFLHYRTYESPAFSYGNYSGRQTSTTGINVGSFLGTYMSTLGANSVYWKYKPTPNVMSNENYPQRTYLTFISGSSTVGGGAAIGFACLDNGFLTGNIKYMPLHNKNIRSEAPFTSCMDSSGYTHLVWTASGYSNSSFGTNYYKVLYNPSGNSPITIITSGAYRNESLGGYLYGINDFSKLDGYFPQAVCDNLDDISLFYRPNYISSRYMLYSKIDKNGAVLLKPNLLYQMPVYFNQNFSVGYSPYNDYITTNYVNTYVSGAYLRKHDFETFKNSNLYQILQSISK